MTQNANTNTATKQKVRNVANNSRAGMTEQDMIGALARRLGNIIKKATYRSGNLTIDSFNGYGLWCEFFPDDNSFRFQMRDLNCPFCLNDYSQDVNALAAKIYDFYRLYCRTIDATSNTRLAPIKIATKPVPRRNTPLANIQKNG